MPYGWFYSSPARREEPKVGHPKRDRTKAKAARRARRTRRR